MVGIGWVITLYKKSQCYLNNFIVSFILYGYPGVRPQGAHDDSISFTFKVYRVVWSLHFMKCRYFSK